jgi:hypothetical protein
MLLTVMTILCKYITIKPKVAAKWLTLVFHVRFVDFSFPPDIFWDSTLN